MKRSAVLISLLGVVALACPAAAQDAGTVVCPDPTPRIEEVFPTVGARGVTVDAPLRIRYSPGYFGPGGPGGDPTTMLTVQVCPGSLSCDFPSCVDEGTPVSGRVQVLGDEIIFFPEGGSWAAGTTYSGLAQSRFGDLAFNFCTDAEGREDVDPPQFGRIDELTSDSIDRRCDAPEGGFRIGIFFEPAVDDPAPAGSIEYLVFQTRGPGIDGPVVRNRARNFNTGGQIAMGFVLPPEDASSTICVRVAAVDGVGNVTFDTLAGDTAECVDPVQGNFFYGLCSIGAVGAPSGVALGVAFVGLVALMIVLRLRRRR